MSYLWIACARNTFNPVKSQQRPEERWLEIPFALYLIGEVSIQIVLALPINGKLVDVVIGDRVTDRLIGRRSLIRLFDLLQHRG